MDYDFTGKVVAVTGASGKSMGVTIARMFLERGAKVSICSRSEERIMEAKERISAGIEDAENRVFAMAADLSSAEKCIQFIESTVEHFGRIDVLINNAAVQYKESALDTTIESWDATMNANARGYFFCMQTAAKDMIRRKEPGSIINIGSGHSQMAIENRITYAAAKAAVDQMTKSAAREWGPYGIRVNVVAAGSFPTAMSRQVLAENDFLSPQLPLRRRGKLEEIGYACLFMASEQSSYITGTRLPVDGGYVLAIT